MRGDWLEKKRIESIQLSLCPRASQRKLMNFDPLEGYRKREFEKSEK